MLSSAKEKYQLRKLLKLLSLLMRSSNIAVIFIPNGIRKERTRLLKSAAVLNTLDSNDPNVFLLIFLKDMPTDQINLRISAVLTLLQIKDLPMLIEILTQVI